MVKEKNCSILIIFRTFFFIPANNPCASVPLISVRLQSYETSNLLLSLHVWKISCLSPGLGGKPKTSQMRVNIFPLSYNLSSQYGSQLFHSLLGAECLESIYIQHEFNTFLNDLTLFFFCLYVVSVSRDVFKIPKNRSGRVVQW